jgi:O-antigen/teichoic acid export membrane protein
MSDVRLVVPGKPDETWLRASGGRLVSALASFSISTDFFVKVVGTYITQIILAALSFVISIAVARALGPAGRGEYAVAFAVGTIGVQFGNLGLHTSNTYYVGKDRGLLGGLLANSILVSLIAGGVASGVVGCLEILCPALLPVHGWLLVLALCWVPFGLAYLLSQNLMVGIHEVRAYNTIELGNKSLALCSIIVLLAFRETAAAPFLAAVVGALICSLIVSVTRLRTLASRPLLPSLALFKRGIGMGLRVYLACFLGFLVIRIDLLMVKEMLGSAQAGYYSIAANMADFILLLPTSISLILLPKLSAMGDPSRQWTVAGKVTWGATVILLPLIGVSALIARPAIRIAFGKVYLPSVAPFLLLLPGVFCLALETIVAQFLASIEFPLSVVFAWLVACVLKIGMNFWAIPRYGIDGASVSSTICYALMAFLVLCIVRAQKKRATVSSPA